jgi:hypothetical protein
MIYSIFSNIISFFFRFIFFYIGWRIIKSIFRIIFGSIKKTSNIRGKQIPKRVKINDKWYNVKEDWTGALNLCEWMSPAKFTAREPYIHISDYYFIYDTNSNKIGDLHITNRTYSGYVTGFEI